MARDPVRLLGAYYIAGGLWPIVHLRSFMAVTGRKREGWLVQSFGLFLAATGAGLMHGTSVDRPARARLALLGALALALSDAFFVARRRIRPIYLADAAIELAFVAALAANASASGAGGQQEHQQQVQE